MWAAESECQEIIQSVWNSFLSISADIIEISNRLGSCSDKLRHWNNYSFKHIPSEFCGLQERLKDLQSITPSGANIRLLQETERRIIFLLEREEMKWHQRSRVDWLRYGDSNTRIFHAQTKARRRRNTISGIRNSNVAWVSRTTEINDVFLRYFMIFSLSFLLFYLMKLSLVFLGG